MTYRAPGTLTLLFTDIEGSTRLLQGLGTAYGQVLEDHHRLLREAFGANGGMERDTAGDGMYVTFPSARSAVVAAVDAQRAIAAHTWPEGADVRVRMGLHTGEPESASVGLVGLDVHQAARISAAAHGGQILVSRSVRELLGNEPAPGMRLVDIGTHHLKDIPEPQTLYQVVAEGLPSDFPPPRVVTASPNNLPREMTSFIGRDREVEEALTALAGAPIVTLTGPGGVGKTRLALQVGHQALDGFEDGVWLVELGPITDAELIAAAVAEALGASERPGRSVQSTLLDYLRGRRTCLVLDNCEHLLEACAALAFALLRGSPALKIIATSREALGVEGEMVLPVSSLPVPDIRPDVTAGEIADRPSVRLFAERAAAVKPDFRLTDQNALAVAQICHRLDGIPLALELAAARVRALPVEQIAERLDDRFRLLTGGNRVAVTRHQTLRATIDWSYQLLSTQERAVFRRLSVFAGGSTLEAAEAVCAGDEVDSIDVLDVLSRLIDKSLVVSDANAAEARFGLLETMRQYARERLLEAGEAEEAFRRHRDHFLALVEEAKPDFFRGPPPARWLAVFDREDDNLRAALEWSMSESAGADAELRLAAGLWRYWEIRGRFEEGRRWLERSLAATDGQVSMLRANALTGAGVFAHTQGDYPAAVAHHEASLAQHRELGNRSSVSFAAHNLANVLAEHGDYARARTLYEESAQIGRDLGDRRAVAIALIALADVISRQGDTPAAERLFEESVAIQDAIGDRWGKAFALDSWAQATARSGDPERARARHEEALAIARELGDERGAARSILHLADLAASQGEVDRARALHRECLRIRHAIRDMPGLASAMERLAWVEMGDAAEDAARLLGAAEGIRERVRIPVPAAAREDHERYVRALAAQLGAGRFEAARLEGRQLGADGIIAALGPPEVTSLPGPA